MSRASLLALLALAAVAAPASATAPGPVLHEPIAPDAREDLAMQVVLEGDIPAAIQTPSGVISAPDPIAPPSAAETAYGPSNDLGVFQPDRDTRRPDVAAYDDPFTPATAPFKRVEAFDAVREDYQLYVRDGRRVAVPVGGGVAPGSETFFEDLVVDVGPGAVVRIPSVGAGAQIVRGRLGVSAGAPVAGSAPPAGGDTVPFQVTRDGADNWFLAATGTGPVRARLVLQVAIARAAFGGDIGDPSWGDLLPVAPLPPNVTRDAAVVRAAIGVSRAMRPRAALAKLVTYFRGFDESAETPAGRTSIYLDLALSKKGVCRHRAFAFLVTAESLGLPARLVLNEAHAWVEVHDGTLWRRIDLGGAGHLTTAPGVDPTKTAYRPPADSFAWPASGRPGADMVAEARAGAPASSGTMPAPGPSATPAGTSAEAPRRPGDDRPPSVVAVAVDETDPHRGLPIHVHGSVRADGEGCAHVPVELLLRDVRTRRTLPLGTLATGDDGSYAGSVVAPASTPLGEYDVVGRTAGDARCGAGGVGE